MTREEIENIPKNVNTLLDLSVTMHTRQKLDEKLNKMCELAIKALEQEPKSEWIPVSKELPEEGEEVLVWYEYFRYGDYNCMWQTYGIGWQYDGHFSVDNGGVKQRVIAWQPLPEPYSEVEND